MNTADLIVIGKTATMDAADTIAEGFAVQNGKIIMTGSCEECMAFAGPATKIVRNPGGLVIPGMTEGHAHASATAALLAGVSLSGLTTVEQYLEKITDFVKNHPDSTIYTGKGFVNGAFADPGPTAEQLDHICSDRCMIIGDFNEHTCWVNSAVLKKLGIDEYTPDPVNGVIVRYPGTTRPTGWLKESAMESAQALIPPFTVQEFREALLAYQEMQLKNGVTISFEPVFAHGQDMENRLQAYYELEQEGKLQMTFCTAYTIYPGEDPDRVLDRMDTLRQKWNGKHFRLIALKIFVDGVAEGHTAYLRQDYADRLHFRGSSLHEQEALNRIVRKAVRRGYIVHTHAIGDAAADAILQAYEAACAKQKGTRNAITHLQLLHEDQMEKMAAMEVVAVVNPYWHWQDPVLYNACELPYLGQERAEREYPMKSLLDHGILTAQASDYPVTVPPRAINSLHFMVNRKAPGREDLPALGKGETITPMQALRVLTWNGAYENKLENQKGSLEPGKDADFVLLDRDLLTESPETIHATQVLQTYLDGKEVFA